MGVLVEGVWHARGYEQDKHDGRFERDASKFRRRVTADGVGGPKAEPHRYHLYAAYFCPWAHRTLIMRRLKGLDGLVGLSICHWFMGDEGLTFLPEDGATPDPIHHASALHEVYRAADPTYVGRVTVPVLWDRKTATIVSNESSEIIRMFNSAFDGCGAAPGDYYPEASRGEIDAVNARVYETVNNGVYKAGFATTQAAYELALHPLFDTLDWLEQRLSGRRFLVGDALSEADIRLVTTLLRFDAVYVGHFKCNIRRIADYPALSAYLRRLYAVEAVASTTRFDHIKKHYYRSHPWINPTGIVPEGPRLDFVEPGEPA